ncbi:MAG: hypothetical protein V4436_02005 [Patescibacteria group bacterium]
MNKSTGKKPSGYVQFSGGKHNMKTTKATVLPMKSLPKTRGPASKGMLKEDLGHC